MAFDPATAALNAITAFFNFACTPAGQNFVEDVRKINQKVSEDIGALIAHMGAQGTAGK